ncbi:hypothetical protein PF004_g28867 [Phytophthora fragariae]|uniref:Uncharacterized protein n=1 Tax=Phytophthora fragariae TaxID=53985 RepID=A0A6G0MGE3_9STRA|nr:hypothetical protein PF004_g28867 [Phytophthora fragariae]
MILLTKIGVGRLWMCCINLQIYLSSLRLLKLSIGAIERSAFLVPRTLRKTNLKKIFFPRHLTPMATTFFQLHFLGT